MFEVMQEMWQFWFDAIGWWVFVVWAAVGLSTIYLYIRYGGDTFRE